MKAIKRSLYHGTCEFVEVKRVLKRCIEIEFETSTGAHKEKWYKTKERPNRYYNYNKSEYIDYKFEEDKGFFKAEEIAQEDRGIYEDDRMKVTLFHQNWYSGRNCELCFIVEVGTDISIYKTSEKLSAYIQTRVDDEYSDKEKDNLSFQELNSFICARVHEILI